MQKFFSFIIRMKQIFTINKTNIMKKSKYQQYFRCFSVCILVPYAFCFSFQQNIVTILISTVFRGAALIRGEALISMWIPKGFFYIVKKNNHRCGAYLRLIANFLISLLLRIFLSCLVIYISNFWESLRTILAPRQGFQLFFYIFYIKEA